MSKLGQRKIVTSNETARTARILLDTKVCWIDLGKKNTLKQGKFWKFSKVAAKLNFKVTENLKSSLKKSGKSRNLMSLKQHKLRNRLSFKNLVTKVNFLP